MVLLILKWIKKGL